MHVLNLLRNQQTVETSPIHISQIPARSANQRAVSSSSLTIFNTTTRDDPETWFEAENKDRV